jgi:hypothetical protein
VAPTPLRATQQQEQEQEEEEEEEEEENQEQGGGERVKGEQEVLVRGGRQGRV